ncbi:MAG: hypothetical protein MRZ34_00605 [Bacillales bacterium]|nr:hypothetical protein [Bacillales bacterium]
MEENIYITNLYDCYGELLTDKQKEYFLDYYFDNLTLSEIADNNSVSRNAIHKQLKEAENKLKEYESKLKLYEKKEKILDLIKDEEIKEKIKELL